MSTFEIYYGATKPIRAVGKHQCRILSFAEKYRGWHSIGPTRSDRRAIVALSSRGCLEVNGDEYQFIYPSTS